jgi:hypothetical protein
MNTVSVAINLPTAGSREDYLHCVSMALTAARERGDRNSATALAGLLTLCDEGIAFAEGGTPHFFNPAWGRTA